MAPRLTPALHLLSLLITSPALAQSVTIPENSLAIGLGANSVDSYRFGQFNGLTEQGGFSAVQLRWKSPLADTETSYWTVEGRNLGLESGGFTATYGRHGRFRFFLSGDQLPHYRFNDGQTPFNGSGSASQTLPANWVDARSTGGFVNLDTALQPMRLDTRRERLTTGLNWQFDEHWSLQGEYRHETKRGEESLGAIFGSTGGNPRGALLARPIDFETDTFTVSLQQSGPRSQFGAAYQVMLFSNQDPTLRWQNPFTNPQWASGANFSDGAVGQIALEPDTRSHQVTFSGAHNFADGSRLSGSLITTRLEQDDRFLPYSSALPAPTALPRADLNGRVDRLIGNLNYSKSLGRRLLLRLRGRYSDRDNRTPQDLYLRIAGDSAAQAGLQSFGARRNRLYDQQSATFDADLSLRLGGGRRLAFGLEHETQDRSSVDVARTREDTGFLRYNFIVNGSANGWVRLSRAERDASTYDSTVPLRDGHNPDFIATLFGNDLFENDPLLRRYHLTDRNRDEASAAVNFFPSATVSVSVLAKHSRDDYPDTVVGLLDSKRRNLAFDLSYDPGSDWRTTLYYNIDEYTNRQAGYARSGGGNPTPFYPASVRLPGNAWRMASEDRIHTVGAGADWSLLDNRLQLALDVSYADAVTRTTPASSGLNWDTIPEVSTLIQNVSISATYNLRDRRELRLNYFFEDYDSSDWALDGVGVDTLGNVLLPGDSSPAYNGHMLLLSYVIPLD